MVVSMLQIVIELPDLTSLKDKRRIIKSFKDKAQKKFRISIAEVDLQDSLSFSQIGAALVSNSKKFGESVMNKLVVFAESSVPGRIHSVRIHSDFY